MKSEQQLQARVKELETKLDLTPDEISELRELRERLQDVEGDEDPDQVVVSVRFPRPVWEGLSEGARGERMSKNGAVVRAVEEKYVHGKHGGVAQEICSLAQALGVLDENTCPAEHAATRQVYGRALTRHYGVDVGDQDSEARSKNSNGTEEDRESEAQLRKYYAFYDESIKKLPWPKQVGRKFRSFSRFRDATAAERRAEFSRLEIREPWSAGSSTGQRQAGSKAGR